MTDKISIDTSILQAVKMQALSIELDCDLDDISDNDYVFTIGSKDFLVLTDEEADEKVKEYIKESLWAFNPSFLAGETDLPEEVFTALQPQCEGANEAILKVIEQSCGLVSFVENAVSADGRGHFLNTYDGNEIEFDFDFSSDSELFKGFPEEVTEKIIESLPIEYDETYYIYRIN